jgi:hypothetical protein
MRGHLADAMRTLTVAIIAAVLAVGTYAQATTLPPANSGPFVTPRPYMQCRGTCNNDAWKVTQADGSVWDTDVAAPRADGKPIDGIETSWENGNLVVRAYSKIGNVGVRFPTFEAVVTKVNELFTADEQRTRVIETSVPFDLNCLNSQSATGIAEDVWEWSFVTNRTGHVGRYYASGNNWYQKFGGKHINCDTFLADSCRFAPLLTPKLQQDPAAGGVWSVQVDGCDVKWTGIFSFAAMRNMRKIDGTPVFQMADGQRVRTLIRSEVLKPASFIEARRGISTRTKDYDIVTALDQSAWSQPPRRGAPLI